MLNRTYDIAYIRKYVEGKLSPQEMSELERAAHADEMLMDLILGMEAEQAQQTSFPKHVLAARIGKRASASHIRTFALWKIISVAASLVAVFGISYYFLTTQQSEKEALTVAESTAVDSADEKIVEQPRITPVDSTNSRKDYGKETRLAFNNPEQNISPAPQQSKRAAEHERMDNILADMTSKRKRSAIKRAESRIQTEEIDETASSVQAKQAAAPAKSPSQNNGFSSIQSDNKNLKIVSGKVLDDKTSQPLPNVVITDLVSKQQTTPDRNGEFIIRSDKDSVNLDIRSLGYESQQLAGRVAGVQIRLRPDEASLEEVVVSGYKRVKHPQKSIPVTGWKEFKAYIAKRVEEENLSKGTVVLKFAIDDIGRPSDIVVERSVDSVHDSTAMEILQNGPDWRPGKKTTDLKLKIKFKKQ